MDVPQELAAGLGVAEKSIGSDGELGAGVRKGLFEFIEKLSVPENANAGYLRRARLALICALRVVDKLGSHPDIQRAARKMLAAGVTALSGRYDMAVLERENGAFHTEVIDLLQQGEDAFVATYAGMASFAAINTVLYDANFDTIGQYEKEVAPDDWDAGFYASLAVSGSAIWEDEGGAQSRAAYWRWYLNDAIPLAWNVEIPVVAGSV
jgi:hypothetical protein